MKKIQEEKGFTILEVLVAVVILGLSYVTVLQCFSLSLKNIAKIEWQRATFFADVSYLMNAAHVFREDFDEETEGAEYISGHKFDLVLISSEGGDLETLKLVKIESL
jgi:prepilin-type N-terminal cleavage/methylation domain-containing protein